MAVSNQCPACKRENAAGKFCSWCAAPLNGSSVETSAMPPSTPHLSSSSSVDEGRFLPGTVLAGRYRIAGLLGRGGMGEVYRATDLTLGQAVALKFLPESLARDERSLARFYNEVRIARQVTHPNVCRVYDIGQVEGQHYISMEFVDGEDLASLLRRIGRLPVDKASETARKLCAGLAAAHERGVLHRDLKPANIMIDGRGQVIIMDFGLAGLSDQLQGDVRSGTPAYMSPEQLAGTEVTFKSDLYALGLVLYELFTGKRAFEASSMVELMDLQQRGAPVNITTLVKELDPAVERIILRCLAPDPRQRPASALGIAAALPGGDPLAAALAAGETPSPELVAAAGETEGLHPKLAVACLAAALVGLAAVAVVAPFRQITEMVHLDNSPEALARDSRTLLQNLGYPGRPTGRYSGFSYDDEYRNYLKQHPAEAAARWKNPTMGEPPLIAFWYRESPTPLVALRQFNVTVSFVDPPFERPRMIRLRLNPDGKLRQLEVIPPQVEPSAPAGSFEWNRLFQAAGLDMAHFQPIEPQWTPLANWDQRAAWIDGTADHLRVEAAAWRGRPVSFRIVGPWTVPGRGGGPAPAGQIAQVAVVYTALLAACILAWLNFRARKTDLRGAAKLAVWCWAGYAGSAFLRAHHVGAIDEINTFWMIVVGSAAVNGGVVWVLYLALEPWVRRRWPQTMISWSRYAVKGLRDPLVGRDLLYSVGIGAFLAILELVRFLVQGASTPPEFPDLFALLGVSSVGSSVLNLFANAMTGALLIFFLLFVLRVVLRKEWLAVAAVVAIIVAVTIAQIGVQWWYLPFTVAAATVLAVVVLRFGLIAAILSSAIQDILQLPHTLDLAAWYAGATAVPLLLLALLAIYGFRTSLGGRRLIQIPD
ncbi:MAG TPA: serine/threonine-protein kinase [Bryobacteraceae bacterium]|jgi:serine/threonine-protein kinase|nr:serine/threonine-protein kinase [Bryobacteraceae bacterium]